MADWGKTLGMAGQGAAIGSAAGPIGTAIGGGIGAMMGLFGGGKSNEQKQIEQQKELAEIQAGHNKDLMGFSFDKQKEMYDYTLEKSSEKEQVKRLKEAGLNPALMYGQGGAGVSAVTGGSAGAGAVSGGSAANAAEMEAVQNQRMMMGLQLGKLGAEIKVLESQAEKNSAEATKTGGIDTQVGLASLNKIITETTNEEVKTSINRIQRDVAMFGAATTLEGMETGVAQAKEELDRMKRENNIGNETYENAITEIRNKATLSGVEIMLKEANVEATKTQTNAIAKGIEQRWAEIANMDEGNRIKAIEAEIKLNMPNITGVTGGLLKHF